MRSVFGLISSIPARYKYVLAALGVIIIIAALRHSSASSNVDAETVKVAPVTVNIAQAVVQPIETVVTAQGTLTPSQGASVKIAPINAGRLVSVRVREGDFVRAGEVVAMLDNRIPQAQAVSASAALKVSELQAQQSVLAAKAAAADHANAVQTAQIELEIAQTDLKKLEAGARPQEISLADQAVKQAKATRDRSATEVDRVKFLYNKGIDSKRQLEDAQTALSVAESGLASARDQASLVRAGARPEDLRTARLRVKSAQSALRQAQQGALQVTEKQRETQAAQESIRQKNADLAAAQATAAYSELRSPISGKVTSRSLNPGDMADTTTPVMEIADTHSLNLVASVPAEDGSAIRAGMPARISLATAPERVFFGNVIDVGQVDPQSGMLNVRLTVLGSSDALKIGAFASAGIVVHIDPKATVVPKSAVITRNGHAVVFIVDRSNIAHQINVTTGVEQGDVIEILSGVVPEDRVITMGQYELSDGAKVRIASRTINP